MITKLLNAVSRIWKLIRGSAILRFSIFLITIGTSFMVPQLWEAILEVIVSTVNWILQREVLKAPSLKSDYTPTNRDYIIGVSTMAVGVLIFVFFTYQRLKNFSVTSLKIYEKLQHSWSKAHNLDSDPEKAYTHDVIFAINLLNETTSLLSEVDSKTKEIFLNSRADDFKKLYVKLSETKHPVSDSFSDDLLSSNTHRFYNKYILQ